MERKAMPQDLQAVADHHGHVCFGVLIGYKACKYAIDLIGESDNISVIAQSPGCGNDAVRFLLDCSEENGKLIVQNTKKPTWSFYNRDDEEGVTLTLNPVLQSQLPKDQDQAMKSILEMPGHMLFLVEPSNI